MPPRGDEAVAAPAPQEELGKGLWKGLGAEADDPGEGGPEAEAVPCRLLLLAGELRTKVPGPTRPVASRAFLARDSSAHCSTVCSPFSVAFDHIALSSGCW